MYTRSLTKRVVQTFISQTHARLKISTSTSLAGIGTHLLNACPSLIRSICVTDNDPLVSEVTQQFFPPVSGPDSLKDSRVQYIAEDAAMWLRNALDQSADAMIIDCTDHTLSSCPRRLSNHLDIALVSQVKFGGIGQYPLHRFVLFRCPKSFTPWWPILAADEHER